MKNLDEADDRGDQEAKRSTFERPSIRFALYLISDDDLVTLPARVDEALAALPAGVAAVQLRAKHAHGRAIHRTGLSLREVTSDRGAMLFVNDRVDVALAVRADGVHLPSRAIPVEQVRRFAPSLLVGVSTHGVAEAVAAVERGADFVTFGPVFPTPSKAAMGVPLGLTALAHAARTVVAPVFALGGIDLRSARECLATGARIACIRAVLGSPSPSQSARSLATLLQPEMAV